MIFAKTIEEIAQFTEKICLTPDDDTPRLVFADWLEEQENEFKCGHLGEWAAWIRHSTLPPHESLLKIEVLALYAFTGVSSMLHHEPLLSVQLDLPKITGGMAPEYLAKNGTYWSMYSLGYTFLRNNSKGSMTVFLRWRNGFPDSISLAREMYVVRADIGDPAEYPATHRHDQMYMLISQSIWTPILRCIPIRRFCQGVELIIVDPDQIKKDSSDVEGDLRVALRYFRREAGIQ